MIHAGTTPSNPRMDLPVTVAAHALFFVKFSRYEYALKAAGKALRQLDVAHAGHVKASAGLLLTDPPRKQVFRDQQLQWIPAGSSREWAQDLVASLKRVQNNLFHGGKYAPVDVSLTPRSAGLVQCAQAVLDELLLLPTLEDIAERFRSYHLDEG